VPARLLARPEPFGPPDAEGLLEVDLEIESGRISRITAPSALAADGAVDWQGGQVWPAFVDLHTHLDKGHIAPRALNPDRSLLGAVRATAADRERRWSASDVRRRFEFGLRCAWAHGTAAIRTHLDSQPPQDSISWPLFGALRAEWAGLIELQAVGMFPLEAYRSPLGEAFAARVQEFGGLLGGVTRLPGCPAAELAPRREAALEALFQLADRHQLSIDLHVDESGDPGADTLRQVALMTKRLGFGGRVTCGHCCSLATQPEAVAHATLDLCAEAGLSLVSLPMCNLFLQDRTPGRTPRWRGVTLLQECAQRGIPIALASDNCRDPFFAYGDHDMLEVFSQAVRIGQLDLPYGDWPAAVTATPAALMGLDGFGTIAVGGPADLVLFRGRSMGELMARPQADRTVLRAGQAIDGTLPDYRELDDLLPSNP
jgi:cytosine deaminase